MLLLALAAVLVCVLVGRVGMRRLGRISGRTLKAWRGDPSGDRMSQREARSVLGVGPDADAAEIERAYRRLIVRVHPDTGGAEGLAAQLNAARAALIGKPRSA